MLIPKRKEKEKQTRRRTESSVERKQSPGFRLIGRIGIKTE